MNDYFGLYEWWAGLWFNRPHDDSLFVWMLDFTSHPLIQFSILGAMILIALAFVLFWGTGYKSAKEK